MAGIVVFSIAVDYMWQLWHVERNRHRTLARSIPETHNDGSHTDARSFVGNLLALRRIILEPSIRTECTREREGERNNFISVLWMCRRRRHYAHFSFFAPFQRSIPWFRLCICVPSSRVTLFHFVGIRFSLSGLFLSLPFRFAEMRRRHRTHSFAGVQAAQRRIIINFSGRNNKNRMCSTRSAGNCGSHRRQINVTRKALACAPIYTYFRTMFIQHTTYP